MTPRKTVIIAMDAFGTLFSPKSSIAEQYVSIAAKCGITGLRSENIHHSFGTSFKQMSKEYPNYGKRQGLNPELWWKAVIEKTFLPHISEQQKQKLPLLVPALIERFWSSDGYQAHDDARQFVQQVKDFRLKHQATHAVYLGIISNSDDRILNILRSLSYTVANLTAANHESYVKPEVQEVEDFEFVVVSYDADYEKPASEIYGSAEFLVQEKLISQDQRPGSFVKLYVGDNIKVDGYGARDAGWNSVIVNRERVDLDALKDLEVLIRDCEFDARRSLPMIEIVSSLNGSII